MKSALKIRPMKNSDWSRVSEIYRQGIETGNATFETKVISKSEWNKTHIKKCRLIAEINNKIAGWAALSLVSERAAYIGVAEVSIYIDKNHRNKKIGSKLLEELITLSEKNGIWTLQASIFPENKASIKIHKSAGFRKVGYREKIGMLNSKWRDTVLFEKRRKIESLNPLSSDSGLH